MSETILRGRALPLGDDISTDILHPPEFFGLDPDLVRRGFLAKFDPGAVAWLEKGDIIVAGRNFGCGSSREAVVRSLVLNGIGAIVALSFARIFFRSCMNLGIVCLVLEGQPFEPSVERGEPLEIDLESGTLSRANGHRLTFQRLPPFLASLRARGGIMGLLP